MTLAFFRYKQGYVYMQQWIYRCGWILLMLVHQVKALAGQVPHSFSDSHSRGEGQITVLWNAIDPYVYQDKTGRMMGVEYELMVAFAAFVQQRYGFALQINWQEEKVFQKMYTTVRDAAQPNLCAVGYFSITKERLQQVQFSMPYMPDLNILVSSRNIPLYNQPVELLSELKNVTGATVAGTTMEADLQQLAQLLPGMQMSYFDNDYEVLQHVTTLKDKIAYVPLSIYVVGLQKGLKARRQPLLQVKRPGFAVVLPMKSDWKAPLDTFLSSDAGRDKVTELVTRYLGAEVAAVVLEASLPDSLQRANADVDLLTREREIVTSRLIEAALHNQQLSYTRNLIVGGLVLLLALTVVLGTMLHSKQRLARQLALNNERIWMQKEELAQMNQKLSQKLAVSRLNPHLIFNALSSVQYFIALQVPDKAQEYVSKMAKFIRMILKNAEMPYIDVQQEAEMLGQFLCLEQMRFQQAFQYEIKAGKGSARLPSLLVFPFVEEAVYHRLLAHTQRDFQPKLCIHFSSSATELLVTIQDDSPQHKNSEALPSMQMALEQIEQLNKNHPQGIVVQKTMAPGNNKVELRIPHDIFVIT